MTGGFASTGRGGAGNMSNAPADVTGTMEPKSTPILKEEYYTSGRGGSGNIVRNTDAEIARAAQDVAGPAHEKHYGHEGPVMVGRGGAGNTLMPSESDAKVARDRRASESRDLKERGKALLEKLKR